jgi:RimJ/RimL family protein N-acetyltransferase
MVVPEFQGRGIAVAATARAIELAKREDKHRFIHAFPNVDNAPSNAICRKLGFELLGAYELEFPKGYGCPARGSAYGTVWVPLTPLLHHTPPATTSWRGPVRR